MFFVDGVGWVSIQPQYPQAGYPQQQLHVPAQPGLQPPHAQQSAIPDDPMKTTPIMSESSPTQSIQQLSGGGKAEIRDSQYPVNSTKLEMRTTVGEGDAQVGDGSAASASSASPSRAGYGLKGTPITTPGTGYIVPAHAIPRPMSQVSGGSFPAVSPPAHMYFERNQNPLMGQQTSSVPPGMIMYGMNGMQLVPGRNGLYAVDPAQPMNPAMQPLPRDYYPVAHLPVNGLNPNVNIRNPRVTQLPQPQHQFEHLPCPASGTLQPSHESPPTPDLPFFSEKAPKLPQRTPKISDTVTTAKSKRKAKKRASFPPQAIRTLNKWFEDHIDNPYPSAAEKRHLAHICDLTVTQIGYWFGNKRVRWKHRSNRRKMKGVFSYPGSDDDSDIDIERQQAQQLRGRDRRLKMTLGQSSHTSTDTGAGVVRTGLSGSGNLREMSRDGSGGAASNVTEELGCENENEFIDLLIQERPDLIQHGEREREVDVDHVDVEDGSKSVAGSDATASS